MTASLGIARTRMRRKSGKLWSLASKILHEAVVKERGSSQLAKTLDMDQADDSLKQS